jgi:arginyl-tRNA synthetase
MMIREEIKNLTEKAIEKLKQEAFLPSGLKIPNIIVTQPGVIAFGDYSTNIALVISRIIAKSADSHVGNVIWLTKEKIYHNPKEVGEEIKKKIEKEKSLIIKEIEIAETGFINFFISQKYLQEQVGEILKAREEYGRVNPPKSAEFRRVNVEFISANPTGPLTLANGRGGFCGDVLVNVLQKAGYKAEREYYVNDAGEQVRKLGHSVLGDEQAVYHGPYIEDLKNKVKGDSPEAVGERAAEIILEEMIKPSVEKMGIKFDTWFSEKKIHEEKEIENILEFLRNKKLTYRQEDALWFKSTEFGDDKDRVLVKENGETTYLASDIAYLKNKFERGFDRLIFFWGADHYGYINRLKAAAVVLGYEKEQIEIVIMQIVHLIQGGQEVKMSKRSGIYVTIDELIDEVGLDVARFFFLARGADSHLNFDLDLAKEQSDKNPVFYVQYAYARICSILAKVEDLKMPVEGLKPLSDPRELSLLKQLIRFPEVIEDTADDYQLQRLPQYTTDLAAAFHAFYHDCHVINEDGSVNKSRLTLVSVAKIVLENTLKIMGISTPKKM